MATEATITTATEDTNILSVETVVTEITDTVYGTNETITPYQVAKILNGSFQALGVEKAVPPQMMYNYSRNGLLVKGEKGIKALSKEQTLTFVTKYVNKYTK